MWEFQFRLEHRPDEALFRQIARALVHDIRRGRLRPGDRLPGTRTLAVSAGVKRVTVIAAYDELAAEGWITVDRARGTFVATQLPRDRRLTEVPARSPAWSPTASTPRAAASPQAPVQWLPSQTGVLNFRSSYPDTRLINVEPLARAYRRVLRRSGGSILGYGPPEGVPALRQAIATMLRRPRQTPPA